MRLTATILCALGALAAAGAASPLKTAGDYVFTRPTAGRIAGLVMGDGGDYRTMRHEDLAFIAEATAERLAFTGDFFDFTNAATNGLPVGVAEDPAGGRRIRRRTLDIGLLDGRFASLSNQYVTGAVVVPDSSLTGRTEVVERERVTYAATSRVELVAHALTNGVTEVHTNRVWFVHTNSVRVVETNALAYGWQDLCCADGRFRFEAVRPIALAGLFRASAITNAYAALRRCARPALSMARAASDFGALWRQTWTGKSYTAVRTDGLAWDGRYEWEERTSEGDEAGTNGTFRLYVTAKGTQTRYKHSYHLFDDPDRELVRMPEEVGEARDHMIETPLEDAAEFVAPFRLCVVDEGGADRIAGGDFFLVARVRGYVMRYGSGQASEYERRVEASTAVVPVALELVADGDRGGYARFRSAGGLTDALKSIAAATGLPVPYDLGGIDVPAAPSVDGDSGSASMTRSYFLLVEPTGVIAFLKLDPTTKLEGW